MDSPKKRACVDDDANPTPSSRIHCTDAPCIVGMKSMLENAPTPPISLAQGIVHWTPPPEALAAAKEALNLPQTSSYGDDNGNPELRRALKEKLRDENGLVNSEVMVTAGANQAYMNIVIAALDVGDAAVLFKPYYFNHIMALQMCGSGAPDRDIVFGPTDSELRPDAAELDILMTQREAQQRPVKMVTVVNPGNPTGLILPEAALRHIGEVCRRHGAWLVVDNTYEAFRYDGKPHHCIEGPNIFNVFSFSKAYGMMGWRVGFLAYPPHMALELIKVQDTIPICPSQIGQIAAIGALQAGRPWVQAQVVGLARSRDRMRAALEPLRTAGDSNVIGGEGAIYMLCRLPEQYSNADAQVVKWLTYKHGVCLIPGSSCGSPGFVRVCYANLPFEKMDLACQRLHPGLVELVGDGTGVAINLEC